MTWNETFSSFLSLSHSNISYGFIAYVHFESFLMNVFLTQHIEPMNSYTHIYINSKIDLLDLYTLSYSHIRISYMLVRIEKHTNKMRNETDVKSSNTWTFFLIIFSYEMLMGCLNSIYVGWIKINFIKKKPEKKKKFFIWRN